MSKAVLIVTAAIFPMLASAVLNFKLEQYNFCPDLHIKITKQNLTAKIVRNSYRIVGTSNITQAVTKPLELHVKVMKCDSPISCVDYNFLKIPQVCNVMKTVVNSIGGFGDFFTPPIRCPIKPGQYKVNVTQSLTTLSAMPIGSSLFKVRMIFYEVYHASKRNMVSCFEQLIRTMSTSSKRN